MEQKKKKKKMMKEDKIWPRKQLYSLGKNKLTDCLPQQNG